MISYISFANKTCDVEIDFSRAISIFFVFIPFLIQKVKIVHIL